MMLRAVIFDEAIKYIELYAQGHFYDKSKMEFPELLEELL